ncbi:hypothetical protein TNCV_3489751 [Trichonephila clavipes]|nr:hypothetical protein TNCV_3489751 [Trichonephila clavipes]
MNRSLSEDNEDDHNIQTFIRRWKKIIMLKIIRNLLSIQNQCDVTKTASTFHVEERMLSTFIMSGSSQVRIVWEFGESDRYCVRSRHLAEVKN